MTTVPAAADRAPSTPDTRALLRWLLGITRPVHPPLLFSLLCRIVALSLDIALFATAAGGVVSFLTGTGGLGTWILVLVLLALTKAAFFYLEQFSGHYVAFKALELLRTYVFSRLWPKAPGVVAHSRSGDILASLTRDVDRIEVVYAHTFAPVVSAYVVGPLAILVAGSLVGWEPVWAAAVCLVIALVVVPYLGTRRAHRATEETLTARRDLAHHVTDSVFGAAEVVGYGREQERLDETEALGIRVGRRARAPRDIAALRRGANVLLGLIATVSVVWLGRSSLSVAAVAALAAGTLRAFEGPRGVEDATGYLDHSLAATRRLWQISHSPEPVVDGPHEVCGHAAPSVRVVGVSYAYPTSDGDRGSEVLTDITFQVPPGGHAIVVGRSGSGKSTLAQLLLRYDDPCSGQIAVGEQDIRSLRLDALRRSVVAVSQRNQVLDATIAENLRLGAPDAADADLWHALEVAALAAEVRAMPDGLDTRTGRDGAELSGGQVQRLCLARALLRRPQVLVLDEFTASLNLELEERIRCALDEDRPDLTIIEITHRLRATTRADLVIVLDRGRVVRAGPPDQVGVGAIADLFSRDGEGAVAR